ncbi:High mobility group protein 2 [Quillaja saponaria]|uniref:High mobility group protein 2 n=1 Tax=Quillaja saponaria TaxID=32244 RepID=A0AAD7P6I0_QUISA|nr:High mobility group protein 2 [Quillaja saponaria]
MKGPRSKAEPKKTDNKLKQKSAGAGKKPAKKEKLVKDPNKPKRPPSAFFVFMAEFREQFKKDHPNNKAVSVVGKAAGSKWKSLSAADKAPYQAKADKMKKEYDGDVQAYNKRLAEGKNASEEEESDKSKSEINDDEEEDDESGEEEEED